MRILFKNIRHNFILVPSLNFRSQKQTNNTVHSTQVCIKYSASYKNRKNWNVMRRHPIYRQRRSDTLSSRWIWHHALKKSVRQAHISYISDTEPKQIMMHSETQTKHAQQNMRFFKPGHFNCTLFSIYIRSYNVIFFILSAESDPENV